MMEAKKKITVKVKKKKRISVQIDTPFIRLDALLKRGGAVMTGGHAKAMIQDAQVRVNGEICTMRGKKLHPGDCAQFENVIYEVL